MTVLRSGALTAEWRPDVGMVGASLRHEGEELLGQRGGLDAYRERGSAFGIPLLAPWANRLSGLSYPLGAGGKGSGSGGGPDNNRPDHDRPDHDRPDHDGPGQDADHRETVVLDPTRLKLDAAGLPKDGVMAGRTWRTEHETDDELVATFDADEQVLAVFPFPHRLRVTVRLTADTMHVTTALTATGDRSVPCCFGWHPLFTLPGVPREALIVRLPVRRESVLDARGLPTGEQRDPAWVDGPLGDRVVDAEYPVIAGPFVLSGGGRTLTVRFGAPDYPVGHAWAPAGESFVAWEPMTAPTNALVTGDGLEHVAPGATATATFSVEVKADD